MDSRSSLVGQPPQPGIFVKRPALLLIGLACLFLLAAAIRLDDLRKPSLGLVPDREFRGAIIARAYYFEATDSVPEWRRQAAITFMEREGPLEPAVTERLVSLIYQVVNAEHLWIVRLVSSLFWLVGGVFLYLIARRVLSLDAAVLATAYYLFVPLGVLISRSFQPDPLMMMMFLCSVFTILRYYAQPSLLGVAMAAAASGVAIFVKPMCLFVIFGAFISLAIWSWRVHHFARLTHLLTFASVSLLPVILYYGYYLYVAPSDSTGGALSSYAQGAFLPHLLFTTEFWKEWLLVATRVIGFAALIGGFLGVLLLREGRSRAFLIGLWGGYFVFGLVFTLYIRSAEHYHLQLIPIVALSIGPVAMLVAGSLARTGWYWRTAIAVAVLFMMSLLASNEVSERLTSPNLVNEVSTAKEIGTAVNHSTNTLFLARYYGKPLQYYGELSGIYWPRSNTSERFRPPGERARSLQERFAGIGFTPDYFIITDFNEYEAHHADLKEVLQRHGRLVARTANYLIYDLRGVDLASHD